MSSSVGMEKSVITSEDRDEESLNFMETELRLGLPGVSELGSGSGQRRGKRSFSEVESRKYPQFNMSEDIGYPHSDQMKGSHENQMAANDPEVVEPAPKEQVVGWPPIRSFRKNTLVNPKSALYVKVSMDGAPYLRKVDLKMYSSYHDLSSALEKMFSCFTMGQCGNHGLSESKLMDLLNGSEYVPTYEDKDGDWMLVGDVPWEMFVDSCKRMHIMKCSEAIGLGI
eukprot:Gb_36564 [translate_table: standard]